MVYLHMHIWGHISLTIEPVRIAVFLSSTNERQALGGEPPGVKYRSLAVSKPEIGVIINTLLMKSRIPYAADIVFSVWITRPRPRQRYRRLARPR